MAGFKQIFRTSLTDVQINPTELYEALGTIRYDLNGVYKFVAFSGTTSVAVGDLVTYLAYASDGHAQIVDQANSGLAAGLAMGVVASGSKAASAVQYATGWIRIRGMGVTTQALAGSPAVGDALVPTGSTTVTFTKAVTDNAQQCAYNYDATAKAIMCNFPY